MFQRNVPIVSQGKGNVECSFEMRKNARRALLRVDIRVLHQVDEYADALQIRADEKTLVRAVHAGGGLRGLGHKRAAPQARVADLLVAVRIVLGFETYKTVLYRGKENKLYELSDRFLTVEISSEDKVFVTNAANKSSVYFYDRGMKQVVILG